MANIIGFCGRCYSGKSELANLCENYGYQIKSFGYPLKNLISNLLSITIDDINKLKNVNAEYIFKDMDFRFLSKEIDIPYDKIKEMMGNKVFKNTREIMQFIGTDIIRTFNPNWHVNKVKETLNPDTNYVFDDVRFPNEREMIENLGGTCWYIVRPIFDKISNHESETSLRWQDFDNVIVNDKTLEYFKLNWTVFMDIGYKEALEERENIIKEIIGNKKLITEISNTKDTFVLLDSFLISKYEFTYCADFLLKRNDIKDIKLGENKIEVIFENDTSTIVNNPLEMEDLKYYM